MKHLQFTDEHGSFSIEQPENTSYLYFPLASEKGLKSSVTPNLGGDAKIDQETFLLEPVSAENLHNNRSVRNFWLVSDTGEYSPHPERLHNRKHPGLRSFRTTAGSRRDSCGIQWKESPKASLSELSLLPLYL